MKRNQSLYFLIYTDLKAQILGEHWEYGGRLPSADQLALQYYVGKWTIRKAMELLEADGLIRTEERRRAVVLYQSPYTGEHIPAHRILRRRSDSLSVYQTMELLMPDILALCSRSARVYELEHFEPIIRWSKRPRAVGCWKLVSGLLHDMLLASGNSLFLSMYGAMEFYAEVSFMMDHQYPLTSYDMITANLTPIQVLEKLQADHRTVRRHFAEYYHAVYLSAQHVFDKLTEKFPHIDDSGENTFTWEFGVHHLYRKISRDLIEKIILGIYSVESWLPSEAKLAKEYGVSVSTIRQALRLLSLLGFIQTVHGKGSKILSLEYHHVPQLNQHEEYRMEFLQFLSGLQLMAIAVRAAVPLAFSHIHANEGKKLREGLKQQNTTPLKLLTDCVIEGISLYPLQAILEKTREIIGWGYYYAIYIVSSQSTLHLNLRCEEALSCLENGNPKGFADCLFDCYCYLFQTVRDFLVGQKISGVGHLKIPD